MVIRNDLGLTILMVKGWHWMNTSKVSQFKHIEPRNEARYCSSRHQLIQFKTSEN